MCGAGEAGAEARRVAGHGAEDSVAGEGAGLCAGPPAQLQQHLHRPRAPHLPAYHSGEQDRSLPLSWVFTVVLCRVECFFYDVMLCSVQKVRIADSSSHYKNQCFIFLLILVVVYVCKWHSSFQITTIVVVFLCVIFNGFSNIYLETDKNKMFVCVLVGRDYV